MKKWICLIITVLLVSVLYTGLTAADAYASNSNDWSVGDGRITDKVTDIVIDSPDADLCLKTGKEKEILITETSSAELSEDQKVHWQMDGTTLRIKYNDSILGIFGFLFGDINRSLTITLPEDLVLDSLDVSVASAEVSTDSLHCVHADFSTASGDMDITLAGDMKNADFSSASGTIKASLETAENIRADAASGEIFATLKTAETFKANTSSGDIKLQAEAITDLSMTSASGEIDADLAQAPEEAAISTASGDFCLTLPENADISILISTASGDFTSQIPMAMNGSTYICGNGTGQMNISTASGDITIRKADQG